MCSKLFLLIFFGCLGIYKTSFSQSFLTNSGARSAGVGNCGVTLVDHTAPQNNIAGIADIKSPLVAASAAKIYNLEGLGPTSLVFIYPARHFSLSIGATREGNEFFNFHRLSTGIANKIGFMKIGLQVSYLQYSAQEFGSRGAVAFELGSIAELGKKINFGMHIFNFTQSTLRSEPADNLPIIMKTGISYLPTPKLKVVAEIEKEVNQPLLKKAGLEYELLKNVYARTGITLEPMKNYFGMGFYRKRLIIDYAFQGHHRLGPSHHLTLGYKLSGNE